MLLLLVAFAQALTFPKWRHPQSVSYSREQLVSPFSRTITLPPRSATALQSNSKRLSPSPRQSNAKLDALEKEIGALKHLLKGGNSTTASEDIREFVLIYEGSDKEYLRSMLDKIQDEKNELLKQETALITSKAAVESKGT